jgi:hypothetical protein
LSRPWDAYTVGCLGDGTEPGNPFDPWSPRAEAARDWVMENVAPIPGSKGSFFYSGEWHPDSIVSVLRAKQPPGIFGDLLRYLDGLSAPIAPVGNFAGKVYEDDRRDQAWRTLLGSISIEVIFTRRPKEEWRIMLEAVSKETAGLFTEASFEKWGRKRDPCLDVPLARPGRKKLT